MNLRPLLKRVAERADVAEVHCTFDSHAEHWVIMVQTETGPLAAGGASLAAVADEMLTLLPRKKVPKPS